MSFISDDGTVDVSVLKQKKEMRTTKPLRDVLVIYKNALAQAWKDGKMTHDERELLRNLRESLCITEKEHLALEEEIFKDARETEDQQALAVYRVALEQALSDEKISRDERAILEKIRVRFNIQED